MIIEKRGRLIHRHSGTGCRGAKLSLVAGRRGILGKAWPAASTLPLILCSGSVREFVGLKQKAALAEEGKQGFGEILGVVAGPGKQDGPVSISLRSGRTGPHPTLSHREVFLFRTKQFLLPPSLGLGCGRSE